MNRIGRASPLSFLFSFCYTFLLLFWGGFKIHNFLCLLNHFSYFCSSFRFLCFVGVSLYTRNKNGNRQKCISDEICIFFVSSAYRYTPETKKCKARRNWWAQVDSNHRPHAYQACALTTWAMSPCCYPRCVSPTCPSSLWKWWRWTGSNRWPPACKAGALPAELHPRIYFWECFHPSRRFKTFKIKQRLN